MVVHLDKPGFLDRRTTLYAHDVAETPLVATLVRLIGHRARLIAMLFAGLAAPLSALVLSLPPTYEAVATLLIEPRVSETSEVNPLQPALAGDDMAIAGEIAVLRSEALVRRLVSRAALDAAPEFAVDNATTPTLSRERAAAALADAVARRIGVRRLDGSRAIAVAFTARDPELAARAANALAELYIEHLDEARRERSDRNRVWLERRLGSLAADLERTERAVERLREDATRELGIDADALVQQVGALSMSIVEATRQANASAAALSALERALAEGAPATALALFPRAGDERLLEEEAMSRKNLEILEARFGAAHPRLERPREEHRAFLRLIEAEAETRRQMLAAEKSLAVERRMAAVTELDAANVKLARARELALAQSVLDREAQAAASVLAAFLQRYGETVEGPDYGSSTRIVSEAVAPYRKASPSRAVLLAAIVLVAGATSVGLAAALEQVGGGRLRTPADLRLGAGLSCASVLKRSPRRTRKSVTSLNAEHAPPAAVADGFARLGASVLAASNGGSRPVLVTSPKDGDGKTYSTSAAALTIAKFGRRVMVLRINGPVGGRTAEVSRETVSNDGEIVVWEGPPPSTLRPESVEGSVGTVIKNALRERQIILVDAGLGPDDGILAGLGELNLAALIVVRADSTTVASLLDLRARLKVAGLDVRGVVLNGSRRT